MPLTTYPIAGDPKDVLGGGFAKAVFTFRPANSTQTLFDGDDPRMGGYEWTAQSSAVPALPAGSWVVSWRSTAQQQSAQWFPPGSTTLVLPDDAPLSWTKIIEGATSDVPLTPSLITQAQEARDEAVAAATEAEAFGGTNNTQVAAMVTAAGPTKDALSATFARFGPTPQAHGAKGDGTTNDTAALQAWLAAGYTEGYVPPGTYMTTATLTQPATMDVIFAPGARIKASAVIAGPIWDTPLATLAKNRKLINAWFDCDNKAQTGLYIRYAAHFEVVAPRVTSATMHSIILGDPSSASASYELSIADINIERPSTLTPPAGSYGLWTRFAQDSRIHGSNVILGAGAAGVRMDRGSNQYEDVHVWGYVGKEPVIGFDDNGGHNVYIGCMADSPTTYGWKFTAFKSRLIACHAYVGVNYPALDNVVTGMYTTLDAPDIDLVACHFEGSDGTHRLAKDFDGLTTLWTPYVNATGTLWDNVATKNIAAPNQMGASRFRDAVSLLATNANAFGVRDSSGAYTLNINTNSASRRIEAHNGAEVRGYSDAGTTQQWRISSATGAFRFGRYTTAARPSGAALQQDDYIHDLTLGKLIRWDGTNWRDAMNNIV